MPTATFDHRLLHACQFAVIEASMIDRLPAGVSAQPMVPPVFAASAHLMPVLLSVSTLTSSQSASLLQAMDDVQIKEAPSLVALFVKTPAVREEFVAHWNALQVCRRTSAPTWLRLHDPRVLHQLLRVLTPAQQATVFGRSTALTYTLGGEWLTVEKPDVAIAAATSWDWLRVERIGLVNRALLRAKVRSPEALSAQGAKAEGLIERAGTLHGLAHADDLVEFAHRGLGCAPKFDEHPRINALLRAQADDDDSLLADRWALLSPEVWAEVTLPRANKEQGIAS
jgi:hypothetical protein